MSCHSGWLVLCGVDAPVVKCVTSTAHVDERNVYLLCTVRARPGLTSLYWQIDNNGTMVAEGRVKEEYWTLVMVGSLTATVFSVLRWGLPKHRRSPHIS